MDQEDGNRTRKKKLVEGEACVAIFWLPRDYGEKLYRLWDFNRGGLNFYAHCTPLQVWNLEIHKIML